MITNKIRYGTSALIALLVVSAITYGVSAWQSPGTPPTGGNVSGPVTVGSGAQTKNGNFTIGSGYSFTAPQICLSNDPGVKCRTAWPSGGAAYSAGSGLNLNASNQFSINASGCLAGQALSWNGSSFSCVSAGGSAVEADTLDSVTSRGNTASRGIFVPTNVVLTPNPSSGVAAFEARSSGTGASFLDLETTTTDAASRIQYQNRVLTVWGAALDRIQLNAPNVQIGTQITSPKYCLPGVAPTGGCITTWPTYLAGSGLLLSSGQFKVNAPSCIAGQALSWNGSSFSCVSAGGTAYSAGAGLLLSSGQFKVNAPSCIAGQALAWNGSSFSCVSAGGTAYSAGAGLLLSSGQFKVNAPSCIAGQALAWNGSSFSCVSAGGTAYSAGRGLTLSGTQFVTNTPTSGCTPSQKLTWNGSNFSCATDATGSGFTYFRTYTKERSYTGDPADSYLSCDSGHYLVSAAQFREYPLLDSSSPMGNAKLAFKTAISGNSLLISYCGPSSSYGCVGRVHCVEIY
jgi:hypothetical protein